MNEVVTDSSHAQYELCRILKTVKMIEQSANNKKRTIDNAYIHMFYVYICKHVYVRVSVCLHLSFPFSSLFSSFLLVPVSSSLFSVSSLLLFLFSVLHSLCCSCSTAVHSEPVSSSIFKAVISTLESRTPPFLAHRGFFLEGRDGSVNWD